MALENDLGTNFLVFGIVALLVGSLTRFFIKKTSIPYNVALLVIGLCAGLLERYQVLGFSAHILQLPFEVLDTLDPAFILFLLLPILFFQSAYSLEPHLFKRMISPIIVLSVPGVIVTVILTAALVEFSFDLNWGWKIALLFGAMISATDSVSVVSVLKEVSSRKRLESCMEGEALLNEAVSIVLFVFFVGMMGHSLHGHFSLLTTIKSLMWSVAGGIATGIVLGYLTLSMLKRVFNDPMIELTVSIVATYFTYYISEAFFHVSPAVAITTLGLMYASAGRTRISSEVSGFLGNFWEMMSYMANTLLSLFVGIFIAVKMDFSRVDLFIYLAILYVAINIIRFLYIGSALPILTRMSINMNKEKAVVIGWGGGLRGAITMALAISISRHPSVPPATADQIIFFCGGIVFLTIIINGTTVGLVLRWMGLDILPPAKAYTLVNIKATVFNRFTKLISKMKEDPSLKLANWSEVEEKTHYLNHLDEFEEKLNDAVRPSKEDLELAYRRRILEIERRNYWEQYESGRLDGKTIHALDNIVEELLDGDAHIGNRQGLIKYFVEFKKIKWLENTPIVKGIYDYFFRRKVIRSYEVAQGLLCAQQRIEKILLPLAPFAAAEERARKAIQKNMEEALVHIKKVRSDYPQIISRCATRDAANLALNQEREIVWEMSKYAYLDTSEAEKMIEEVEKYMHQQKKSKF